MKIPYICFIILVSLSLIDTVTTILTHDVLFTKENNPVVAYFMTLGNWWIPIYILYFSLIYAFTIGFVALLLFIGKKVLRVENKYFTLVLYAIPTFWLSYMIIFAIINNIKLLI